MFYSMPRCYLSDWHSRDVGQAYHLPLWPSRPEAWKKKNKQTNKKQTKTKNKNKTKTNKQTNKKHTFGTPRKHAELASSVAVEIELRISLFLVPKADSQGFFTFFFLSGRGRGGEACFRGRFSVPIGDGVRWGGGLISGMESDERDFKKLFAEAKNSPYSKIRANFGVLSINRAFWCSFELKSSRNWKKKMK